VAAAILSRFDQDARRLVATFNGTRPSRPTTIRPNNPATLDEARSLVASFVAYYNDKRLHSATGYIAPADKLAGREKIIWDERDRKLEAARDLRRQRRNPLLEATS